MDNEKLQPLIIAIEALISQTQSANQLRETSLEISATDGQKRQVQNEALVHLLMELKTITDTGNEAIITVLQKNTEALQTIKELKSSIDSIVTHETEKDTSQENIPITEALNKVNDTLLSLLEESKKKDNFKYDIEITPDLFRKLKGENGKTPEKGKDYFTQAEIADVVSRATEVALSHLQNDLKKLNIPSAENIVQVIRELPQDKKFTPKELGIELPPDLTEAVSRLAGQIAAIKNGTMGTGRIEDFANVDLAGLQDGYALKYDLASKTWKPGPASGGGGTPAGVDGDIQINEGGAFGVKSGKFKFLKAIGKFFNLSNYGTDIAPLLTTGNWSLGTGWSYGTSPNRLIMGVGVSPNNTALMSGASTVVAGQRYKITFTCVITAGGGVGITIGDNPYLPVVNPQIPNAPVSGTYTFYLTANNTTKFAFVPFDTNTRGEITALSIQPVTSGTGDGLIEGDLTTHNIITDGTLISARVRLLLTVNTNNLKPGGTPRFLEILTTGGVLEITGLDLNQVEGQEVYITPINNPIRLMWQNASSSANNRFTNPAAVDVYLAPGDTGYLQYQGGNTNRWQVKKFGASDPHWLTDFTTFISNFILYSDPQLLGNGKATIFLPSSGVAEFGDTQSSGNLTKVKIDDTQQTIQLLAQYVSVFIDGLNKQIKFGDLDNTGNRNYFMFDDNTYRSEFTTSIRTRVDILSNLGTGQQGDRAFITDAVAPVWGTLAVGGGGNESPVYWDSINSAWYYG